MSIVMRPAVCPAVAALKKQLCILVTGLLMCKSLSLEHRNNFAPKDSVQMCCSLDHSGKNLPRLARRHSTKQQSCTLVGCAAMQKSGFTLHTCLQGQKQSALVPVCISVVVLNPKPYKP